MSVKAISECSPLVVFERQVNPGDEKKVASPCLDGAGPETVPRTHPARCRSPVHPVYRARGTDR